MTRKGFILFFFLLALYKNFQELERPGNKPTARLQYSTEYLGLSSVIRSLRRTGFMGFHLYTRKVAMDLACVPVQYFREVFRLNSIAEATLS